MLVRRRCNPATTVFSRPPQPESFEAFAEDNASPHPGARSAPLKKVNDSRGCGRELDMGSPRWMHCISPSTSTRGAVLLYA